MKFSPVRIFIGGTLIVILLLFISRLVSSSSVSVLGTISPLSEEIEKKAQLQKNTQDKKTTENYPPNQYFPKTMNPTYTADFEIHAKAYAVLERGSGELLLAKNITEELPIASTTKIMTALVALEGADLDLELTVSSQSASIGEATMGLSAGERVRVEELLYGAMLPSGNDATETLAEGLQGGRNRFLLAMNEKAHSLGMFDTFFFNPSGLDEETREGTNYSTCLDMLALTNYALSNETFAKIAATYYKEFPYKEGKHKAFYLYNILQLDRSYPGIKGVKPGITDFAQETLVSYAENGGKQIIVVLLGTQNSRDEVVKMYDFVFGKLGINVR